MDRLRPFLFLISLSVIGILYLELMELNRDITDMKGMYSDFLSRKVGGATLEEKIQPGSLAVFKTSRGMVACGMMR